MPTHSVLWDIAKTLYLENVDHLIFKYFFLFISHVSNISNWQTYIADKLKIGETDPVL